MKVLYPGSFDPITAGHLDIIRRCSECFEEVIVTIMKNPKKTCTFTEIERKALIEKCVVGLKNVKVEIGEGLTVEYAKKMGCKGLIRGIRAVADYEYEMAQATSNMILDSDIETFFLLAKPEYSFLSSSIAKEVASYGGDISNFIPKQIVNDVTERLKK